MAFLAWSSKEQAGEKTLEQTRIPTFLERLPMPQWPFSAASANSLLLGLQATPLGWLVL